MPEPDRIAAVFLLWHDGAALLQQRDDLPGLRRASQWVPPGGHVEPGESVLDCARREFREETEYDAPDLHFLLTVEDVVEGWPPYQLTVFWAYYDGKQSVVCHEGQQLAFIARTAATNYSISALLLEAWDAALATAGAPAKTPSH